MAKKKKPSELVRLSRASLGRPKKPKAPKASPRERQIERLRHPTKWPSFARWQLAIERVYGRHHIDWPRWALDAMAAHVRTDLRQTDAAHAVAAAKPKPRAKKKTAKKR